MGEFGGLNDDVAHTAHRGLEVAYFVKERRLGRLMHLVDGVVHHRDQSADVAAIERRNEGAPHGEQDFPRDLVRVVFIALDFLTMFRRFLAAIEQRAQRMRAGHNSDGVPVEEIEEALFLRH
ncbi:MAG: hypothetical protein USCAAHI_00020 [Beijerinckiaceae bacterium]|nr:MAG: hypothetical protein USCAAHI_00020 [Beijerinckiaceae bacterium]